MSARCHLDSIRANLDSAHGVMYVHCTCTLIPADQVAIRMQNLSKWPALGAWSSNARWGTALKQMMRTGKKRRNSQRMVAVLDGEAPRNRTSFRVMASDSEAHSKECFLYKFLSWQADAACQAGNDSCIFLSCVRPSVHVPVFLPNFWSCLRYCLSIC